MAGRAQPDRGIARPPPADSSRARPRRWSWAVAAVLLATIAAAAEPPPPAGEFLAALERFADQAIARGRDRYGQATPLFVDGVEVTTGEALRWKWADGREWVLCNLSSQQGLFRLLDGLSTLTGQPRYRDAAKAALRYAFDHLRYGTEHNGGLLAWGGHLAYNASDDLITGQPGGTGRIHELKCFFPHYALMWEVDPVATRQQIENSWNSHILDWASLDFNRHGLPQPAGRLWQHEYQGGPVFFWGRGLTFHNAASDFYYAAALLGKFTGEPAPLLWARRLSQRYTETCDPQTGLEGFQFSQTRSAWCDDVGKILGDRAQYQYGEDFPGHRVYEGTLFPCYGDTPMVEPQLGRLAVAELLGAAGEDFLRAAVGQLTAWGRSAYRAADDTFLPMLTDGTSMEGYVCKKDGYFGPKGRVLTAGRPRAAHLLVYARAFRLTGDPFLWQMARAFVRGAGGGELGATPGAAPTLTLTPALEAPDALVAWLELHRRTGRPELLAAAVAGGRAILRDRVRDGWFVRHPQHRNSRLANDESQALLQLAATLRGQAGAVPLYLREAPFFHAEYGSQPGRVYDTAVFFPRSP